jgi:hypothetical protein
VIGAVDGDRRASDSIGLELGHQDKLTKSERSLWWATAIQSTFEATKPLTMKTVVVSNSDFQSLKIVRLSFF